MRPGEPGAAPAPSRMSRNYFASYLWNSAAKLGDFGLVYLFSVLLARMLDPVGYGSYATILSLSTLVFVLSSMGIDRTLHRYLGELSATPQGRAGVPSLLKFLLAVRIALLAALVAAVVLGRDWIALRYSNEAMAPLILAAALYMVCQSLVSFASNILVGLLRTRAVGVLTVAFRAANLGLAYLVLRSGGGVREILVLLGASSAVLLVGYLWKTLPLFRGEGRAVRRRSVLGFAASAWVLTAVGFGLGKQSDVILLNAIRHSQSEIAFYDVAFSITQVAGTVLTVGLTGISLALFSRRQKARPEEVGGLWRSFVVLVGSAVVPFVAFLVANAHASVVAVYGPEYREAGGLLAAYALPMGVGWLLGGGSSSTFLQATHRIRTVLAVRVVMGATNVVLNVFLIRLWGAQGALAGTGICAASAVIGEALITRRVSRVSVPGRHLAPVALAVAVALVPSLVLRPEGLLPLLAHGLGFSAIYAALLTFLRPLPELDESLVASLPAPLRAWMTRLSRPGSPR